MCISGIGQISERHKINLSAIARNPKGARALRELRDKIQREIDSTKGILGKHGIPIDIIELNLEPRGFIDKPITFDLNKQKKYRRFSS